MYVCDVILWHVGNQITEVAGLSSLRRLTHLSLAGNRIDAISNLDSLPLQYLKLVSILWNIKEIGLTEALIWYQRNL